MKQRAIVLVPFPFSDQRGFKIRPALVVSNDEFNKSSEDLIVCSLTTNRKNSRYLLPINEDNLEDGILYEPTCIKVENIFKVQKSAVINTIALINKTTFLKVNSLLSDLFKV